MASFEPGPETGGAPAPPVITLAWLALAATQPRSHATYPVKPITLVVPFAAGSGTDGVARIVAQKLSERLKQQVLVENKAGASAQIGADSWRRARPTATPSSMTTNTSHSANPSLFKSLRYDPIKDFTPIVRIGELPFALAVNPTLPVKSMAELLRYASDESRQALLRDPEQHLARRIRDAARLGEARHRRRPLQVQPAGAHRLVGGQLELYVVDLGSGLSTIKSGKVRTLAVTPARSSNILPDVPPLAQALPGFDLTSWNGIFGPAGLPKPIVDRLNTEVLAVLADKEVQDKLANIGFEVLAVEESGGVRAVRRRSARAMDEAHQAGGYPAGVIDMPKPLLRPRRRGAALSPRPNHTGTGNRRLIGPDTVGAQARRGRARRHRARARARCRTPTRGSSRSATCSRAPRSPRSTASAASSGPATRATSRPT